MSQAPPEGATPPPANAPQDPPPADPPKLPSTDWKAEARKWEDRAKENKTAADELARIKAATQTEAEKLAGRAEAAEKRAAETESRLLRLEVAAEKGLNPSQAKRLVGSTREELAADADELVKTFKPAAPSFDGGVRTPAAAPKDMNALIRERAGFTGG